MTLYLTNEDGIQIRQRTRASIVLPHFADVDRIPSPNFDKMELTREYLLANLNGIHIDLIGELAHGIRVERRRPNHRGELLDECISFRELDGRYHLGAIGFKLRTVSAGRSWLIGMEIKFSSVHSSYDNGSEQPNTRSARIKVTLDINPTRIIGHARSRRLDIETASWRDLLTSDERTVTAIRQTTTDSGDNILPSASLQSHPAYTGVNLAARCVSAVEDFLHYLLVSDQPRGSEVREEEPRLTSAQPSWQIRYAEVYEEFGQLDAADYVRRLMPAMKHMASDLEYRYWTSNERSPFVSYFLPLTKTVNLTIYAKAHDRIRVEVKYAKRVPSLANGNMEGRLRMLAEMAVQRIEQARRAIVERVRDVGRPANLAQAAGLLSELSVRLAQHFADRPALHGAVLEILLVRGGIDAGENRVISTEEARVLAGLRILQTRRITGASSLGNRYALSLRYAPLFELFQQAEFENEGRMDGVTDNARIR